MQTDSHSQEVVVFVLVVDCTSQRLEAVARFTNKDQAKMHRMLGLTLLLGHCTAHLHHIALHKLFVFVVVKYKQKG